jgi:uncharacterized protein with PQ loop repeat
MVYSMTEFVGYVATGLVMLSFTMKDMTKLRIINALGCMAWIAYGVMLNSYPVIITNVGILLINLIQLFKNVRSYFKL